MNSNDYNKYLSVIKKANEDSDKETLRSIQKQLIAEYGLHDNDVERLIKVFRYNI